MKGVLEAIEKGKASDLSAYPKQLKKKQNEHQPFKEEQKWLEIQSKAVHADDLSKKVHR
jgi:hypothetical protein